MMEVENLSDNECVGKREMTFEEDAECYTQKAKELLDSWYENHNDGSEDPQFIWRIRESIRVLKKAELVIKELTIETEELKKEIEVYKNVNLLIAGQRDERDKEIDMLQDREIELENQNEELLDLLNIMKATAEAVRIEAIKEFASAAIEELTNNYSSDYCHWIDDTIYKLKKERIGDSCE